MRVVSSSSTIRLFVQHVVRASNKETHYHYLHHWPFGINDGSSSPNQYWSILMYCGKRFNVMTWWRGSVMLKEISWDCIIMPSVNVDSDRSGCRHCINGINSTSSVALSHDDDIKWKHFPRNWPFVREIHRSPVNFPHKGQWRGALMFSLIYAWTHDWVNNREAGDLRRQHGHYDVIVMKMCHGRGTHILSIKIPLSVLAVMANINIFNFCCLNFIWYSCFVMHFRVLVLNVIKQTTEYNL